MKVTHVIASDWEGIYFGNELVLESQFIYPESILKLLIGKSAVLGYESHYIEDNAIWLDARDCLPETLEEFYKLEGKND